MYFLSGFDTCNTLSILYSPLIHNKYSILNRLPLFKKDLYSLGKSDKIELSYCVRNRKGTVIKMDNQEYFEEERPNAAPNYQPPQKANALATGAFVCGLLAAASAFTCLLPLTFILTPCSIILALLSKGSDTKMHKSARIGVIGSVTGITLCVIMITSVMTLFFTNTQYRRQLLDMVNQASESAYGMDFEEALQEIYGEDFNFSEFFMLEPESTPAP